MRGEPDARDAGEQQREPRRDPQAEQGGEGPPAIGSRPVQLGIGGQQEAGDHRADKAVQHLVAMPERGLDRGRQDEETGQRADPQGERNHRPGAAR